MSSRGDVDILITEAIEGPAIDALAREFRVVVDLEAAQDSERLAAYLPAIRGWIVRNQSAVTRSHLERATRLQVVGRAGVGLDNIDTEAAEELGVVVAYTPTANAVSVAELTLGLILCWNRHIHAAHDHACSGQWDRHRFMGEELAGQTLGIIGLGRIGREVAQRAGVFGLRLLGYDPYVSPDDPQLASLGVAAVALDDLLAQSNIVSLHVPLTASTRHLIDAGALQRMQKGALVVNTSRGPIIDEAALVSAIESGQIGGAALDVREAEPPVAGRLESLPQVLLTPHIGAFTHAAQRRVVQEVAEDVARVLNGQPAQQAVGRAAPGR